MSTTSTIGERVAEMHAKRPAMPSDGIMAAFGEEQVALAAGGLPAGLAEVGVTVPDIDLIDAHGAPTSLYRALAGRKSVLVFYRGAWCPYCNIALNAYQTVLLPRLTERGVGLVAISPQRPDGSLSMQEKNNLAFAVLSDPGNTLAGRLGILTQPSDGARAAQLQLGLDLTAVNADGTTQLPMPATVILDAMHVLRWIDVHPDYSTRTEAQQVLDALDDLDSLMASDITAMESVWSKLRAHVTPGQVEEAIAEYDRMGPDSFFAAHGYGPSRTHELEWKGKQIPAQGGTGTGV
jgi:peroxiredoxin